jgi:AraC-like DNA-binding protein
MNRHWSGEVWVGAGAAYFIRVARGDDLQVHSLLQVAVALDSPFTVVEESGRARLAEGAVIPGGNRHRFHAEATAPILSLFLEPNSKGGRALESRYPVIGEVAEIDAGCVAALRACWEQPGARRDELLVHELIAALVADTPPSMGEDGRVAFAQDYIANHLADAESLDRVAGQLGLTTRYLRKLFDRELGMSPQRYRQWCKLRTALECVAKGTSFTTAAATAGFTDSAHFSRTFRGMFGAPPSSLLAPRGDYEIMTAERGIAR